MSGAHELDNGRATKYSRVVSGQPGSPQGQCRRVRSMYQLSTQVVPPSGENACSQRAESAVMPDHRNRARIGTSL